VPLSYSYSYIDAKIFLHCIHLLPKCTFSVCACLIVEAPLKEWSFTPSRVVKLRALVVWYIDFADWSLVLKRYKCA